MIVPVIWSLQPLGRNEKRFVLLLYEKLHRQLTDAQDVSVDEAEIRSNYDAGALGKVYL